MNVKGIFSGHHHWTKKIIDDGLIYYVLGSMTENINNDGIPDKHLVLIVKALISIFATEIYSQAGRQGNEECYEY